MPEALDKLAIKLCESLPLDSTIYERVGLCTKPNDGCQYCMKTADTYFCSKKTYTPILPELESV